MEINLPKELEQRGLFIRTEYNTSTIKVYKNDSFIAELTGAELNKLGGNKEEILKLIEEKYGQK